MYKFCLFNGEFLNLCSSDIDLWFLFFIVSLCGFDIRMIVAQVVRPVSRLYVLCPRVHHCIEFTSDHAGKARAAGEM